MAKMSFARKKAYFPTNLTQLNSIFIFHACAKAISFLRSYFDLSLSLSFFFLCLSSILTVLLPTLSSFFCREFWLANFLGKGQI